MSGSIAGLLGALDQQTQNQIQQPPVLGLLGNATQQLLPTDPFAAQRAAAAAQAAQTPAQATPISAMQSVNDWAASQNKNAYGTNNQQTLGILGSAGFPLMNDPRLIQGRLADIAQGTVKVPGVSQQDAEDEFWRQMYGRRPGWGGGAGGWGGGMGGDTAETAAAAAEHEQSAAAAGGGGSNLYG